VDTHRNGEETGGPTTDLHESSCPQNHSIFDHNIISFEVISPWVLHREPGMVISTTTHGFKYQKHTLVDTGVLHPEKFHEACGGEDDVAENKGSGITTEVGTEE